MREIVGTETTLAELLKYIEEEDDPDRNFAYMRVIYSALSPISYRKAMKRSSEFVTNRINEMLLSGKSFQDMQGVKIEGYKEDEISALKDALNWEMSLPGKLFRIAIGRDLLKWDKVFMILEDRKDSVVADFIEKIKKKLFTKRVNEICIICGEPKDRKRIKDARVVNVEPCADCRKNRLADSVLVAEVMGETPTGRGLVIAVSFFENNEIDVDDNRIMTIEYGEYDKFFKSHMSRKMYKEHFGK